jgi:glycosyltransferase involved in cell wall biosynthesis
MKVLSIGTDRGLFVSGSPVQKRTIEYAARMEMLHVIVFSLRSQGFIAISPHPHVVIHPTNSANRWWYVWDALRIGRRLILSQGFVRGATVVTSQDPFETGFVAFLLARLYKLAFHIQIHTDIWSDFFAYTALQKIRVRLASFLIPRAQGVRLVSQEILTSAQRHGVRFATHRPPTVLPIRVMKEEIEASKPYDFKKEYPHMEFVICMANRLTPEKDMYTALRACEQIIKQYPYVGLCIAGDGPLRGELEAWVKMKGLEKNIVFLGSRTDVFSLMKGSKIFLTTSLFEGYGMSLVEAGFASCAVVSTAVGIAPTLITQHVSGALCPVGDSEAIQKEIAFFIHNPLVRDACVQELFSRVQSYVPDKETYIQAYIRDLSSVL